VHRLLADQVVSLGLESFYRITQTSISGINGTEFLFAGLRQQDVAKIKSFEGVDRVWVEEAQTVTKRSWDILVPTIRKPDSEIWISFNPDMDSDETYVRFVEDPPDDSIVVNVNWHDNPWFPEVLKREMEALKKRDPDAYENVWEGKCKSVVDGAIYLREIQAMHAEKRIRNVPYDPLLKVHTVWDLGWNDQMSIILVQKLASELRIIEYIEDSHRTLAEYVADLGTRPYRWGVDFLPHDGAAKDYKTGKSAQEILSGLGRRVDIVPKLDIESGIKAGRLAFPRCYFDKDKALRLVDCLKRYRRSIPVTTNEPGAPLHDEYSHGADAFRYLATIADRMMNDDHAFTKKIAYSNAGII
jgi:phage terminase large subunit